MGIKGSCNISENKEELSNFNIDFFLLLPKPLFSPPALNSLSIFLYGILMHNMFYRSKQQTTAILAHEMIHIKKIHGLKAHILNQYLGSDKKNRESLTILHDFQEYEADMLPNTDYKNALATFYSSIHSRLFLSMPGYLCGIKGYKVISKIVALHEAERRLLNKKSLYNTTLLEILIPWEPLKALLLCYMLK